MRMLRPLFSACLALAGCSSQGDGSSPEGRTSPPPAPATVQVSVRDGNGAAGPFRIDDLETLRVDVHGTGLASGEHQLRLDVVSPGGTLYANLPATLEAGATGEGTTSIEVQVAGTTIERYHRSGTWTVRTVLDGAQETLATADAKLLE